MTPDLVVERLAGRKPDADGRDPRGDHDLNPDTRDFMLGRKLTEAAVLVPLVERPSGLTVLLTRRTDHLTDHAGQVSFPGGRREPEDPHPEATALRETEEEIGLPRDRIRLIGRLDTYVTGTGYRIVPVVGLVAPPFDLALDPFEVAEAFEVPLDFLMDPANRERGSREWQGRTRHYWWMPYGGKQIWGATAGMLVNLAALLGAG